MTKDEAYAAGKHFYDQDTGLMYFYQGTDKPYHVSGPLSLVQKKRPHMTPLSFYATMTQGPKASFPDLGIEGLPE